MIKVFEEAGLSLKAIQEDALTYFESKRREAEKKAREQREANERAERFREWSPRELAQAKAERTARAAAIADHGRKILAARSRNEGW
ncbi:hypothetical protein D3C79_1024680 [compost metagenome]